MEGNSLRKGRFFITTDPEESAKPAPIKRENSKNAGHEDGKFGEESKAKGRTFEMTQRPGSPESTQAHSLHKPSESQPDNLRKVAVPPFLHQESPTYKSHAPLFAPKLPLSDSTVSMAVFESFASVVSEKFTEMLQLHRDIMMEIIHKEERRDEEAVSLCRQNADLVRQLVSLEAENSFKREFLPHKD